MTTEIDRHVFVIFGGTGDLARRKLIPSLYRLITENGIADRCVLLGVAPGDLDDDAYRAWTRAALKQTGVNDDDLEAWCDDNVFYQTLDRDPGSYERLRDRIETIEEDRHLPGNRAFYLALPPSVFPSAITGLGEAGLNESPGWTRLVIEKPIRTDLKSARDLNSLVHNFFHEAQVYRIDHYLGKETVQTSWRPGSRTQCSRASGTGIGLNPWRSPSLRTLGSGRGRATTKRRALYETWCRTISPSC